MIQIKFFMCILATAQDCTGNDVRLVDGFVGDGSDGRVEVCLNGQWSGICDSQWDTNDAIVICSQIGFPTTSETQIHVGSVNFMLASTEDI